MNAKKKWNITLIALTGGFILLVAVAHYIIDPLQYFRLASFYTPAFHPNNARELNAGFIKNYDYETIVIGSSLMGNSRAELVDEVFDTKSVNITIFALTIHELNITLKHAINIGKAKQFIMCLDIAFFNQKIFKPRVNDFPYHLYDESLINDLEYVFNFDLFREMLLRLYRNNYVEHNPYLSDVATAYNWVHSRTCNFSEEQALALWTPAGEITDPAERKRKSRHFYEQGKKNFDINIYPHLKENPDIKFYLLHPPLSVLFWLDHYNMGVFEGMMQVKDYIYQKTRGLSNVTLHDFQAEDTIVSNLDYYSDYVHYSPEINDLIILSLNSEKYIVKENTNRVNQSILKKMIMKAKRKYAHKYTVASD